LYKLWHLFIRAADILKPDIGSWLDIDRMLGLGYGIQAEVLPLQYFEFPDENKIPANQDPNGNGSPDIVERNHKRFDSMTFEELDNIFCGIT
jgi:hypothetical protein